MALRCLGSFFVVFSVLLRSHKFAFYPHDMGAQKKIFSTPTCQNFFFTLPEGGGGEEDPFPPPLRRIISYANNPHSKSYIIKGQGRYYRADTQPPGRVPATHSAEQRRKREIARESGHNEHSLHGEGTPATTLLRQDSLATKRLRKASRWRGLHLLLRGQLR